MEMKRQYAVIQELCKRLCEIAAADRNKANIKAWADHNELDSSIRPLLWVCPDDDGGWLELVSPDTLQTQDTDLRVLESKLRRQIYQYEHFQDDFCYEPVIRFDIPGEYTGYLYGSSAQETAWGISIEGKGVSQAAYHLDNFLQDESDFEKLLGTEVDFIPNNREWTQLKELYETAVSGMIEIQFILPYSVLVQSHLIELVHLRGLGELMYDLYDEPDRLLAVLRHMGESKNRLLTRLENENMLFDNATNLYTGSGGLGYLNRKPRDSTHIKLDEMWGFADSQEFSGVSAQMFHEFALLNQKIGLNRFGYACYGCCESLDDKIDMIFQEIPRLRRLSVSPWSDVELAAERIGRKAIYSWKPNPALICEGFADDDIRALCKRTAQAAKDCVVEVILKDIRTCAGTPVHLQRFVSIFRESFGC